MCSVLQLGSTVVLFLMQGIPDSTDSLSTVPALEHFFHKIDHLCNQIQANLIKPISPQCGTWYSFSNSTDSVCSKIRTIWGPCIAFLNKNLVL